MTVFEFRQLVESRVPVYYLGYIICIVLGAALALIYVDQRGIRKGKK